MSPEDEKKARELIKEMWSRDLLQEDVKAFAESDLGQSLEVKRLFGVALIQGLNNPDAGMFDLGVTLAADLLRQGTPLPPELAAFVADVLEGDRKRPTKRGPDPNSHWKRDYELASIVVAISRKFGLPEYTNNDLSNKVTAVQLVADTLDISSNIVLHALRQHEDLIK